MSEGGAEINAFMQHAESPTENLDKAGQEEVLDPAKALERHKALYTPQSGAGDPKADYKAYDPTTGTFDF